MVSLCELGCVSERETDRESKLGEKGKMERQGERQRKGRETCCVSPCSHSRRLWEERRGRRG